MSDLATEMRPMMGSIRGNHPRSTGFGVREPANTGGLIVHQAISTCENQKHIFAVMNSLSKMPRLSKNDGFNMIFGFPMVNLPLLYYIIYNIIYIIYIIFYIYIYIYSQGGSTCLKHLRSCRGLSDETSFTAKIVPLGSYRQAKCDQIQASRWF